MPLHLNIQDRFTKELPADPIQENTRRQVKNACFSYVTPKKPANPSLLHVSPEVLAALGLEGQEQSEEFLAIFSGAKVLPKTHPYAMCYGGHQFGNWAGQLGDGRAINLAEVLHQGQHWALQLKGSGETPYSRTADGLAVLRSSIREYLCSEAMHHLGISTTRALSLMTSGNRVWRDMLYDGNPEYEKGAIVCRVAPSFLRFGSYEIHAANQDSQTLQTLVDYTIQYHYPHLGKPSKEVYINFFAEVATKSLEMVMHWQRVGFVHGVMNTDNMSILGLTIDYGPYGWLEGYDHGWTPNTTDRAHKRYRYGAQPQVVLWNLLKLANALYPLIGEASQLQAILDDYHQNIPIAYDKMMRGKLGLTTKEPEDQKLIEELERILQLTETDMTLFFRLLANFTTANTGLAVVTEAFYQPDAITQAIRSEWDIWFVNYQNRLTKEHSDHQKRIIQMHAVNPKYVLRNYMAQLAIDAAEKEDYSIIDELFHLLKNPYNEQPKQEKWFAKRPEWARHKIGCSMLSCSS